MRDSRTQPLLVGLSVLVVLLLVVKFFWTYVIFHGVPFGYDAGMYRFLFIREAAGWPPFLTPDLPEWARSHAPGLFFLTSPLVMLGLSPDVLIGWVWNFVPVALICLLAQIVRKTYGDRVGFFLLLAGLVSVVQMQGFLMMYYKVFVAMLFCVLAFFAFESRSRWWMLFGMMTIAIHQQIGLIFAVATFATLISRQIVTKKFSGSLWLQWLTTLVLGTLWYLPTFDRSLGDIIPLFLGSGTMIIVLVGIMAIGIFAALLVTLPTKNRRWIWCLCLAVLVMIAVAIPMVSDAPDAAVRYLFSRTDTIAGAFFSISEYLWLSFPLLLLGIIGLVFSFEKERGNAWQWAAITCGVAVIGMLFFYRRFLLPLDFFLLPFAAIASDALWRSRHGRSIVLILLTLQAGLMTKHIALADPHVKKAWLEDFSTLHEVAAAGSTVIVLDNMAPWVVGYLPDADVSGPGIFNSRPYTEWEKFLLGSSDDRQEFIAWYPEGTFFFASPVFTAYYPPEVQSVLTHSCFVPTSHAGLYQSVCGL